MGICAILVKNKHLNEEGKGANRPRGGLEGMESIPQRIPVASWGRQQRCLPVAPFIAYFDQNCINAVHILQRYLRRG